MDRVALNIAYVYMLLVWMDILAPILRKFVGKRLYGFPMKEHSRLNPARSQKMEELEATSSSTNSTSSSGAHVNRSFCFRSSSSPTVEIDVEAPLRAVSLADFKLAMKKLTSSVDENGREMQKVVEWNDKYGEIRRPNRKKKTSHLAMYI